jgi:hypothetical protein
LDRDLARLQQQLRAHTGTHPLRRFLDGLIGGLILGAALALFAAHRAATMEPEPLQGASIELKERVTHRAQGARDGAGMRGEQAQDARERGLPGDKGTEA